MTAERRGRFRRPPGLHRPPAPPAPETPDEVLERAADVSRETSPYVAGGQVPAGHVHSGFCNHGSCDDPPPPLHKAQVARLEAITAIWERSVRLEGPADATLLYQAPPAPPPPPRPRAEETQTPAPADTAERPDSTRAGTVADHRPAGPARRVSDWTSRHDQRSLEFPVRRRLERAVPLSDVSLDAGPVLDQGTTPPLSLRDASACVGMACTAAGNVLALRRWTDPDAARDLYDGADALELYHRAQQLDQLHGEDYAGTSVLAGMKAGQEAGLWPGYLWALGGTKDVAQVLLQLRVGVVVGIPWSAGLEDPDRDGIIRPGGEARGGHCLLVKGLRLQVGRRPGPWFELQQSRGPAEGIGGTVYLHHSHLARLLAGIGEAGVPLPAELLQ